MTKSKQNILLLGSYGRGNLGDDAFLLAALKLFKGHRLFINSANDDLLPEAVKGNVTTIATNSSRDLAHKLKVFRSIDHIVYCGGDLWVELYGDRFPRQSLYKMVLVNLIARICGKKVHYLGCGIGRLHGWSLFIARLSARLANGVAVREQRSARVLGLKKVRVLPDLVTNIDFPAHKRQRGKTFTIGVSILYYLPNPEKTFPLMVRILSKVLGNMPEKNTRIVLFPMLSSPTDPHDDAWASEQLAKALPGSNVSIFEGREVDEYVDALSDVDLLIGTRLHANIIALMAGVPTLGISYRPKVGQFFEMSGLGDYYLELENLNTADLAEKIQHIRQNYPAAQQATQNARNHNLKERHGYQDFIATYF